MARLTGLILALASILGAPAARAAVPTVAQWHPLMAQASRRFGIPEPWIARVMQIESGGHPRRAGQSLRSPAGAMGLMQLMPATWNEQRARLNLGSDPDDPQDNIIAGAAYLRAMYERFGYPGLFAAYNAGPRRFEDHLRTARPLPQETLHYLAAIVGTHDEPTPPTAPRLFAVQHERSEPQNLAPEALFAISATWTSPRADPTTGS